LALIYVFRWNWTLPEPPGDNADRGSGLAPPLRLHL
jgi:hypothetical protein